MPCDMDLTRSSVFTVRHEEIETALTETEDEMLPSFCVKHSNWAIWFLPTQPKKPLYVGSHKSCSIILLCMEQCRGLCHELHRFRVYVGQACYHTQIVRSWGRLKRVGRSIARPQLQFDNSNGPPLPVRLEFSGSANIKFPPPSSRSSPVTYRD